MSDGQDLHPPTPKQTCQLCIVQRLSTLLQVDQDDAYKMGAPLVSINLGTEEPKLGDVAITAAHRAIRGHFLSQKDSLFGGFYKGTAVFVALRHCVPAPTFSDPDHIFGRPCFFYISTAERRSS